MVQIQGYDLDIRQIKWVKNHLADILSRNPSGMTEEQTRNLTRPHQMMVQNIQVHEFKKLKKGLTLWRRNYFFNFSTLRI